MNKYVDYWFNIFKTLSQVLNTNIVPNPLNALFGFLPFVITATTMDSVIVFTTLQDRCVMLFCVLLLHFISCQTFHCVTIFYKSTKKLNKKTWNTNVFGVTRKDGLSPTPTEEARIKRLGILFFWCGLCPFKFKVKNSLHCPKPSMTLWGARIGRTNFHKYFMFLFFIFWYLKETCKRVNGIL